MEQRENPTDCTSKELSNTVHGNYLVQAQLTSCHLFSSTHTHTPLLFSSLSPFTKQTVRNWMTQMCHSFSHALGSHSSSEPPEEPFPLTEIQSVSNLKVTTNYHSSPLKPLPDSVFSCKKLYSRFSFSITYVETTAHYTLYSRVLHKFYGW